MTAQRRFTRADLAAFERLGIPKELLEAAQIQRVTHEEAIELCGIRFRSKCLSGILFPNLDAYGAVRDGRIRRDHPEVNAEGRPIAKYIAPPGRHHLYFPPGAWKLLEDLSVPVVMVEAEKSALALTAAADRAGVRWLVVALGGCYGWRGTTGITNDQHGERVPQKGPLPDLDRILWTGRESLILFDANAATNPNVQKARRALARELAGRGARVRIPDLPADDPNVNGPDDYIAEHGDAGLLEVIGQATAFRSDVFTVPIHGGRIEATDVQRDGGTVRAVVAMFSGERLCFRDRLNLTSARNRKAFLKAASAAAGRADLLKGDPVLELEQIIWAQPSSGEPVEPSNSAADPKLTEEVRGLLEDPNLLDRVVDALRLAGWVGDTRAPLLAYFAMTSRLFRGDRTGRTINLAFVSQAASGKNAAVDAARTLIPEEACYIERAGSERALIYTSASFKHVMVIFAEADSIPDEGPAASAIRSLASDNVLAYDTVEQNSKTQQYETRRIEKPGPTGLLTTSTRSLAHQLGTRVLEVTLNDDPEQTRRVMRAQAEAVAHGPSQPFDAGPFVAAQRWLAATCPHIVVIPYAPVLSELLPAAAVRMRRDFQKLLACVQAIALLHVLQRDRTEQGAIVATLDDYATARKLLGPVFTTVASDGLTSAVRETVEAIGKAEELTQSQLCGRMKLVKSTVSWRVKRAVKAGWLKNLETRRGHPARLTRGEEMPDEVHALPTVESVRERFEQPAPSANRSQEGHNAEPSECSSSRSGDGVFGLSEEDSENSDSWEF